MLQAQYHPSPKDQARVAQMFAQHMNAEVQVPDRNGGRNFQILWLKLPQGRILLRFAPQNFQCGIAPLV